MNTKSTLAKFIDNSFYCITLIIFSIIWCGYITSNLKVQIIIGILVGCCLYLLIFKLTNSASNKKTLARSTERHKNACIQTLSIANPTKTYLFFQIMLNQKYNTTIHKPFIVVSDKTNEPSFLIHFNFYTKEFTHDDLFKILEDPTYNNLKLLIFSKTFSSECIMIAKALSNICLLDEHNSYLFFKYFNTFPKISEKIKEKRFQNLKNNIFSSINSKQFIKISLLLVFLSLFTRLRKYYLITASILFIFAIICRFKKEKSLDTSINFETFINSEAKN